MGTDWPKHSRLSSTGSVQVSPRAAPAREGMSGFQLAARNRVAIAAAPMATPDGPLRVLTTSTQKPSTIAPASAVLARSTSFGCDMKVKPPTRRLGPRQPATYGIPVSVVVMDAPLTTCGKLVSGD